MEIKEQRPRLLSLRVVRFNAENTMVSSPAQEMQLQLSQDIEVGLGASPEPGQHLQAMVQVRLSAKALNNDQQPAGPYFEGVYEGKFEYPVGVQEVDVASKFETELYQYVLVAQAFPLAMSHFRKQLLAMGVDARKLPLGI
jgi:hypothetical protein